MTPFELEEEEEEEEEKASDTAAPRSHREQTEGEVGWARVNGLS